MAAKTYQGTYEAGKNTFPTISIQLIFKDLDPVAWNNVMCKEVVKEIGETLATEYDFAFIKGTLVCKMEE